MRNLTKSDFFRTIHILVKFHKKKNNIDSSHFLGYAVYFKIIFKCTPHTGPLR